MVSLSEIAKALNLDPKEVKQDFSTYGKVISINADKTYQVSLNGSDVTVKCARLTGAKVGDIVLVTVLKNGYAVVTGCVGGDKDAAEIAQHFWTDSSGAHVTEVTREDFDDTPAGGNLLLQATAVKIRRALMTLAELDGNGMYIYSGGNKVAEFTGTEANITNASGYKLQLKGGDINFIPTSGVGAVIDFLAGHYIKMRYSDPNSPSEVKCEYGQVTVTGDLVAPSKSTLGALDNGIFDITTETILASTSISGNSHTYSTKTINDASRAKYYPLGIVGWNSPDTSAFIPARLRLSDSQVGSATVSYDIRNVSGSSVTGKVNADILWLKVTA